jgi:hypothetical protein
MILASERVKTVHVLGLSAIVTGHLNIISQFIAISFVFAVSSVTVHQVLRNQNCIKSGPTQRSAHIFILIID